MSQFLKKEKKVLLIVVLLYWIFSYNLFALENPAIPPEFKKVYSGDTKGSFKIVPTNISSYALTGLKPLSKADYDRIANLPHVSFQQVESKLAAMPSYVNNALNKYFRPIFSQWGSSCAQASGIGYTFTYEIDFMRNLSASIEANQYPTHYTWNFLNGGYDSGSWYFDGWDIIKDNGCPNVPTWGEMFGDYTRWMSGYNNYFSSMQNRVTSYEQIANVNTPEGLANLKRWVYDHGNGSTVGGLGCFAVMIDNADYVNLAAGTPNAGKMMLIKWGDYGYHAMTVVGYDDTVRYDFNGDGQYTNNLDINGDGIVNMSDWEIGALIFANSWGTSYGDNGFCYMAYKSIADLDKRGYESLTWNSVHVVRTQAVYHPQMALKTTVQYTSRNRLHIYASVTQNGSTFTKYFSRQFDFNGGDYPMRGSGDYQPIELGLDITSLYEQINPQECAQFNLLVEESDYDNMYNGTINSYSLVDYTSGSPVETVYPQTNIPIANNTLTTLSITRCPKTPIRVQYYSYNVTPVTNTIFVDFRIYNDSGSPILLSNIKNKYWYTSEATWQSENVYVDWAGIFPAGTNITSYVNKNISAINQRGQDRACTISFNTGTRTIPAGGFVECIYRIAKCDWSNYNQSNDYSFGAQRGFADWTKITAYLNNTLVYGTEP